MTSCSGCGKPLGYKKYKFHRMWRIPGYYCKQCMLTLGKEFDAHGKITFPKKSCDLCDVEYYYLRPARRNQQKGNYCHVCHEAVINGVIPDKTKGEIPKKLPNVMMIFAGLGVLMMVLGLVWTLTITPGGDSNLVNILFGAVTTALGFVLFRKTIKSRNLILAKEREHARQNGQ